MATNGAAGCGRESRHSRRSVLALLAVPFVATSCSRSSKTELAALRSDPLATWLPAGATVVREFSTDYRPATTNSKPRLASLARTIQPAVAVGPTISDGRTYALAHGWSQVQGSDMLFAKSGGGVKMNASILPSAVESGAVEVVLQAWPE